LVLVGILVNRMINEPEPTLKLLKKMFALDDNMAKYNVARSMSSALQRNPSPCPGYQEFFADAILDVWTDEERAVTIEARVEGRADAELRTRTYPVGHLAWPLIYESQYKLHGTLDFADRFLSLSWSGSRTKRLVTLINTLGVAAGVVSFRVAETKPYPILETLAQWFHVERPEIADRFDLFDLSDESVAEVQTALGQALARIWSAFPNEVEQFLEEEPELLMRMYEAARAYGQDALTNFAGQGTVTSMVLLPAALPGLIKVLQSICEEGTVVETAVRTIGGHFVGEATMRSILASL